MNHHDQDTIPPSISVDRVLVDPEKEPMAAKKWNALVRRHGTQDDAFAAMLYLHQENTLAGDPDGEIYDLSESELVGLRIPKAVMIDIKRSANKNEVSVEREILNRLGFILSTKETII